MKTTIDKAGRIVIPKAIRDEIGLAGGELLDVSARDGRIEIEIPQTPMRLVRRGKGLVAVADADMPTLTAAAVREVLEQVRR